MTDKQITGFLDRLKDERKELRRIATYHNKHSYFNEENHVRTKIEVLKQVIDNLELIMEGKEIKVSFNL